VLPYDKPILLVLGSQEHLDYVARSLVRMGYDDLGGYLAGTIASWYKEVLPVEGLGLMTVADLRDRLEEDGDWVVLDVRSRDEWEEGHIEGCTNIYVGLLQQRLDDVP